MKTYSEFVLTEKTDNFWFATVTETNSSFFSKESNRIRIFREVGSTYWRHLEDGCLFDFYDGIYSLELAYRAKEELENSNG